MAIGGLDRRRGGPALEDGDFRTPLATPQTQHPTRVTQRCILHADADRFYYAVEALERPELAQSERPIVVGHDPRQAPRAIVTTANDAARRLGIVSGMAGARALRLAPDALFVSPRFDLYGEYSRKLMALLRTETAILEQLSIDEAWLDWSHRGFDRESATELRKRVLGETGLSVSLGVAASKLVSKMATEAAKEEADRVFVVRLGEEPAFLGPLPLRALWGVGPKTAARLQALGAHTIGQIADLPLEKLIAEFGLAHGRALFEHSRGEDDSELSAEREPKSYSAEHTFQRDTRDRGQLWAELRVQAHQVGRRLEREGLRAAEVAIKLRYADWTTITRQVQLGSPSADASMLAQAAALLMRRHWDAARAVRLIGLRAGRLERSDGTDQLRIPEA
jgi:DNA polymerase IV